MTTKAKLAEQARRGVEAKALIESGPVKDALDKIEAELVSVFKSASPNDAEAIRNAHLMMLLLERFRSCLRQAAFGGAFAAKELLRLEGEKTGPS
jgi:hypothetical protein